MRRVDFDRAYAYLLENSDTDIFALSDTHGRHRRVIVPDGPKIHIFGHIHSEGGKYAVVNKTRFYNVSTILV